MYSAFLNDCLLFCLLFLDPEICKIHVCKVPREKTTSMRWTAKRLQKASNSFQYETNANYYFIFMLHAMRDFTWGDLDGLFLGFEEELLPSGKKKPDILFLLPRENWAPNFIGILYYKSYDWSNEVSCQPITRRELSHTLYALKGVGWIWRGRLGNQNAVKIWRQVKVLGILHLTNHSEILIGSDTE